MPKSGLITIHAIGSEGFAEFARTLREVDAELGKGMRREIKAIGEVIATDARGRASWSSRIPGSVKTSSTLTGAAVVAGGARAPHAVAMELGSSKGAHGQLRHPVFGRKDVDRSQWTWVNQPTRPFLFPAFTAHEAEVVEQLGHVIEETARKAGFR